MGKAFAAAMGGDIQGAAKNVAIVAGEDPAMFDDAAKAVADKFKMLTPTAQQMQEAADAWTKEFGKQATNLEKAAEVMRVMLRDEINALEQKRAANRAKQKQEAEKNKLQFVDEKPDEPAVADKKATGFLAALKNVGQKLIGDPAKKAIAEGKKQLDLFAKNNVPAIAKGINEFAQNFEFPEIKAVQISSGAMSGLNSSIQQSLIDSFNQKNKEDREKKQAEDIKKIREAGQNALRVGRGILKATKGLRFGFKK